MIAVNILVQGLDNISILGDSNHTANSVAALDENNSNDNVLMWVNERNISRLQKIKHGVIITSAIENPQPTCTYILTPNPRLTFLKIVEKYFYEQPLREIKKSAKIHVNAKLGKNVSIGENVIIEKGCSIGDNVEIGHNTVIFENTEIHNNVKIGANNTIGGVGFGYEKDDNGSYLLIPHIGNVIIQDNVEIGNNTCIDRAALGSTTLHTNCKIDNLVHIAHGVKIGMNSLVIANSMIAGSVKVGENSWIAPSVSILNQLSIGDNNIIGMGAVVIRNTDNNSVWIGNPAIKLEKKKY